MAHGRNLFSAFIWVVRKSCDKVFAAALRLYSGKYLRRKRPVTAPNTPKMPTTTSSSTKVTPF